MFQSIAVVACGATRRQHAEHLLTLTSCFSFCFRRSACAMLVRCEAALVL
jgi:hypothetical protein